MIGATIALGLAKQSYKVALIEKHILQPFDANQPPDMRLSALNMHSFSLLSNLGAWQHLLKMRYRPYNTLSVWDAETEKHGLMASLFGLLGHNSRTQFKASEVGQPLLGYFIENRLIQLALFDEIKTNYSNLVDCIFEKEIININVDQGTIALNNDSIINSKLIIGADGANSKVRQAANIATSGWQYSQQANAIVIETTTNIPDETWQAFHNSGPRALLPMYDRYACLVWYDGAEKSKQLKEVSTRELKQEIKRNFPDLKQEFEIINLAGFGLTRMHAHQYGKGRALIAGDAAHTINPLAGQGVNLGFQDASALLDIIRNDGIEDSKLIIMKYEQKRKAQNLMMMSAMDVLYQSFSSSLLPINVARNIGLSVANNAGPIKQMALKYAMGLDK